MKIYTKKGDKGMTTLYDGTKVSKSEINLRIIGEVDELSSRIGMLCVFIKMENGIKDEKIYLFLRKIQHILQNFNSYIAIKNPNKTKYLPDLESDLVEQLEEYIDSMEKINSKLTKFILPGVSQEDSQAHLCRTQTRKVEREVLYLREILPSIILKIFESFE